MKLFKAEVIADSSGQFCGNGLRFSDFDEAEDYAVGLSLRWTAVSQHRVVEVECKCEPKENGETIHVC